MFGTYLGKVAVDNIFRLGGGYCSRRVSCGVPEDWAIYRYINITSHINSSLIVSNVGSNHL